MRTLTLPLKGLYFDQIKAGTKPKEYRLCNDYWKKRLVGKHYDRVELTRGYPKRDDLSRRHVVPYQGYAIEVIDHEFFGGEPVTVFAIDVSGPVIRHDAIY